MNKLTPQLNDSQLKENISAMQSQGVTNDQIQKYVDNYQPNPAGGYSLKPQNPSFLQHEKNDIGQLGQDLGTIGHDITNIPNIISGRDQAHFGEGVLNSAADVARIGLLNPLKHAVGSIYDKVAPEGLKQSISDTTGLIGQGFSNSAPGKFVGDFSRENPDISRAFGSAGDVAATAGLVTGGVNAYQGLKHTLTNQAVPGITKTLNQGLNYSPEEAANIANTISSQGRAAEYVAQGNYDAAKAILNNAMTDATNTASATTLDELNSAFHAIDDLKSVAFQPTGLTKLASGIRGAAGATGHALAIPFRHPIQTGAGLLGAYEGFRPGGLLQQYLGNQK